MLSLYQMKAPVLYQSLRITSIVSIQGTRCHFIASTHSMKLHGNVHIIAPILLCCIAIAFTCQPVRQNGRRSEKRQECSLYSRQRKHLLLWRRCELWNRPPMMSRKELPPIVFHNPQVWEAFILCQGRWEMWNRPPMMFTPIVFHNPQVWEASQGRWQTNPYTQWVLPSQVPQLTWLWVGRTKVI